MQRFNIELHFEVHIYLISLAEKPVYMHFYIVHLLLTQPFRYIFDICNIKNVSLSNASLKRLFLKTALEIDLQFIPVPSATRPTFI